MLDNGKALRKQAKVDSSIAEEKDVNPLSTKVIVVVFAVLVMAALFTVYGPRQAGLIPQVDFSSAPAEGAIAVLLVALFINFVIRGLNRLWFFSKQELSMIYWMSTFGGLLTQGGLMFVLPLSVMSYQKWVMLLRIDAKTYRPFLEGFSTLIIPKSEEAVAGFWFGNSSVPWGEWIIPIVLWTMFFSATAFLTMCLSNLVYKQWSTVEHLTYPLTKPILAMIEDSGSSNGDKKVNGMWNDRLSIIGMAIGGILFSGLASINHYYPMIPCIPLRLDMSILMEQITNPSVRHGLIAGIRLLEGDRFFVLNPLIMAFGWFVNLDLLFSFWFFHLCNQAVKVMLVGAFGPSAVSWYHYNHNIISTGAYIGVVVGILYVARHQTASIFRSVISKKQRLDDSNELLSYRTTVVGGSISLAFLLLFGYVFLHISLIWLVLVFGLLGVFVLGFARLRAEGGIPTERMMCDTYHFSVIQAIVGLEAMGGKSSAGLNFFIPFSQGAFTSLGAITQEAAHTADAMKISKRVMTRGLMISGVAAIIISWVVMLPVDYRMGVGSYNSSTQMLGEFFTRTFTGGMAEVTRTFHPGHFVYMGSSMILAILIGYLRSVFLWWPLHPIGLIVTFSQSIELMWGSFFAVWVLKWIALRYGGRDILLIGQRVVIGFIVGNVAVSALFSLIGLIVGY
jgi:hypothetical protein